jgi:chemotaxis signal transduction protein
MPDEALSLGTVSAGGITYPITNLALRLRIPEGRPCPGTRLVLYGSGTAVCAFIVDEIVALLETNPRTVRSLPAQFSGEERTRLSGLFLYGDTVVLMVNPSWLLESGGMTDAARSERPVRERTVHGQERDPVTAGFRAASSVERLH